MKIKEILKEEITEIKLFIIVIGVLGLLIGFGLIFNNFENMYDMESDCNNPVLDYDWCEDFNLQEEIHKQKVKGVFFGLGGIVLIVGGLLIRGK